MITYAQSGELNNRYTFNTKLIETTNGELTNTSLFIHDGDMKLDINIQKALC